MTRGQLSKILFVDDDDDLRTIALFALEAIGHFEVVACASGKDALTRVGDFMPQLLLLDVMMPDMDGPSVLVQLRTLASTARTPVIFMTGKDQPDEIERLLALGAMDVIAKPFDPLGLADTIRAAWEKV